MYYLQVFQENVSLKQFSHYKIGGKARYFFQANGLADLLTAAQKANKQNLPTFILGGGTNLLISDDGYDGLVLKPNIQFLQSITISDIDRLVHVGAGILVSDLLNFCVREGLSGWEWAGGLPGTLGGAIRGNAGAFGGEVKDSMREVLSLDWRNSKIIKRDNNECQFGYRDSIFKRSSGEIIIAATINLQSGNSEEIAKLIHEKIDFRKQRHPLEYPNVGSIFKNVPWENVPVQHQALFQEKIKKDPFPILPAAVLIDRCNLKGVNCGGATVSSKHPNFIVNNLNATANDVKNLIGLVKNSVLEKFNITLEEEVYYLQ